MRSVRTAARPRERGRAGTVGWLRASSLTELGLGALPVAGSFVTTSLGFTLLAREGLRRRLRASASSR